nr:hypothetical protein [Actinomycetota bacterium]
DQGSATFDAHVFWAGDSRAYLFDPSSGAQQLTTDDIKSGGDAMRNLSDDSVMSNCISASTEFHISHRAVELTAPFLVLCATDGCFGYVRSPMHFEHLILSCLATAEGPEEWRAALIANISAITGDDASLALVGVGADLAHNRELFAARTEELERRYVAPLNALHSKAREAEQALEDLRSQQVTLENELWEDYRLPYERFLNRSDEGAA